MSSGLKVFARWLFPGEGFHTLLGNIGHFRTRILSTEGRTIMPKVTRRQALQTAAVGAAVVAVTLGGTTQAAQNDRKGNQFVLPPLPYAYDALTAAIDEQTMRIHHTRHHQAYITGLNAALAGQAELQKLSVEELLRQIHRVPQTIRQRVINHGGGHANHKLFWEVMAPRAGGEPTGDLAKAINTTFKSFEAFKKQFSQAALDRFGSGWAWLVVNKGRLEILSTANQDSPLMEGKTPILGLDVWEHAYYLRYQNMRVTYVNNWWQVVNWANVAQRYAQARA